VRRAALLLLVVLAGCGSGDNTSTTAARGDARTVEVEMRDIAFSPTSLDVRVGEKVRFVFKNTGGVTHDAFIGDQVAQDEHEKEMRGGHAGHAMGSNGVSVKPGTSASLTYAFDRAGQVVVGCHQPGHYTGGMRAIVTVA
jgi:uncharacterized cupredoxin-like copper-binding protein